VALTSPVLVDGAVVAGMAALHGTGTIGTATIGMAKTGTATTTITIASHMTTIASITASSEWAWDGGRVTMAATDMEDARGCGARP
jgi:hypothetical protein